MGMGQRVNPHTIRVNIRDYVISFNAFDQGLFNRKIKLEKIFGKTKYKRIVNKVKILSR